MKKDLNSNQKYIYTLLYLLMSYTLTNTIGEILLINYGGIIKLLITLMIGGLVQLIIAFPLSLYLIFIAVLPIMMLANYYNREFVALKLLALGKFVGNVWNHLRGREEILHQHTSGLWILIVFVVCIFTATIIFKSRKYTILLPVYLYILIFYWYLHVDVAYSMLGVFLLLFLCLIGLEAYFKRAREHMVDNIRNSEEIFRIWFKTIIGYGLIVIIIASILPKFNYRIDLHWLEYKVNQHFPTIATLRDDFNYSSSRGKSTLFSLTETGYQESRSLGGPVKQNDRLVMKVKAPYQLYLRGSIKSVYSKNSWFSDDKSYITYLPNESLPISVTIGKQALLEITYVNFSSNTIFSPYQPMEILLNKGGKIQVNDEFHVIADKSLHKNDKYLIKALTPSEKSPGNYYSSSYIQKKYLQLPLDLSPKIKELADIVTIETTEEYLKTILLRDYLRNNYLYSTDVPIVPMNKEFVEYFLFEGEEGYCTYFATAMAIMLRTQGIPSRYVEGYRLPSERNKDGIFEVRQNNAHAWVEAYIPEMGWITVEATPAYNTNAENPTRQLSDTEANAYFDELDELKALMELQKNSISHYEATTLEDLAIAGANDIYTTDSRLSELSNMLKKLMPMLVQLIIFAILPFRCFYIHIKYKRYRLKLIKGDAKDSVILIYNNIRELLELLEYPLKMGETPQEYDTRIKQYTYDSQNDFTEITNIFMVAKYSNNEVLETNKYSFLNYLDFVDKKTKNHLGFWKYNYFKFIKGKVFTVLK